jgi:hypothetical protein
VEIKKGRTHDADQSCNAIAAKSKQQTLGEIEPRGSRGITGKGNNHSHWVQAVRTLTEGEVIGVDGKTARRSHNKGAGIGPLHLVNAWATRDRLVLGQLKVDEKSNEITAVPELLRLLEIKGCIVTVDALNTQKAIANEIRERGADYVMALKENHPKPHSPGAPRLQVLAFAID